MQIQPLNKAASPVTAKTSAVSPESPQPEAGDSVTWTFQYDARGLNGQVSDLKLKGSFNPETGKFDPQ